MVGLSNMEVAIANQGRRENNRLLKRIAELSNELDAVLGQRDELTAQLAVQQCSIAGLVGSINALKAQHPDSPLLVETGQTLNSGKPETVLFRDHFVPEFDAAAKQRDVVNPEMLRSRVVR